MIAKTLRSSFVVLNILIFLFILAPIVVLIGASLTGKNYLAFPPQSISFRWFEAVFDSEAYMNTLWTSIRLGAFASIIALVIGTLSAYGLERLSKSFRNSMTVFFNSPLQMPTIVLGISLLQLFNSAGVTRNFITLLLGHIILCLPYVVRTVGASLFRFDLSVEEAALTLGAPGPIVFWEITLPLLRPALIASIIFGFVVSFGNLAISMFLTNSRIATLPIQMFSYMEYSPDPSIAAMASIIIFFTILIMYLVERLVGLDRVF